MSKCLHEKFESEVRVRRLCPMEDMPPSHYSADVRVRCATCKMDFRFLGMALGLSWEMPMASIDAIEARLPIHPNDGTTPIPQKIKGFTIKGLNGE